MNEIRNYFESIGISTNTYTDDELVKLLISSHTRIREFMGEHFKLTDDEYQKRAEQLICED